VIQVLIAMSDDEVVWDSSFAESVRTLGSDFGDSFNILAGEEVNAASFVAPEPPAGFFCPRCGKRYKTKRGFDSHIKMHNLRGWLNVCQQVTCILNAR